MQTSYTFEDHEDTVELELEETEQGWTVQGKVLPTSMQQNLQGHSQAWLFLYIERSGEVILGPAGVQVEGDPEIVDAFLKTLKRPLIPASELELEEISNLELDFDLSIPERPDAI
jgi:hypothetical protein